MRRYIFLAAVLLAGVAASAQNLNPTVQVTNDYETKPMAADALKWAAYTYVIAAIGSLATLLYYISIANRRN